MTKEFVNTKNTSEEKQFTAGIRVLEEAKLGGQYQMGRIGKSRQREAGIPSERGRYGQRHGEKCLYSIVGAALWQEHKFKAWKLVKIM